MRIEKLALLKGYTVNEIGQVFNRLGKRIKLHKNACGYLCFTVSSRKCKVHRLVAFSKFGEALYGSGIETRHKNGEGADNRFENILIGTHLENMQDMGPIAHWNNIWKGSHAHLKHDWKAVFDYHEIVQSYAKTMARFGITSKGTLFNIIARTKAGLARVKGAPVPVGFEVPDKLPGRRYNKSSLGLP